MSEKVTATEAPAVYRSPAGLSLNEQKRISERAMKEMTKKASRAFVRTLDRELKKLRPTG